MAANRQAIGGEWPRPWPRHVERAGRHVRLEPLAAERHAAALYAAGHGGAEAMRIWDYLGYGPFADEAAMATWLRGLAAAPDPQFYAIVAGTPERALGVCSLLRMEPAHGVVEVGHIWYAPALQRRTAATEAMFLLFAHVFEELGYRRLEWKCDAGNARSRRAAERLGFSFEGIFRQHMVVKGRNRDTAWFGMLDHEWPRIGGAMRRWLDPANFDGDGAQVQTLRALIDASGARGLS